MSYFGQKDYMSEVAIGNVSGATPLNKFGRNSAVASGATEEIWDGSATYVWPATALMTSISQTADQAAMRGASIYIEGLDANLALTTQTATLDASDTTTVVTLDTALRRCFRMEVNANVVSTSSIRVHNAGETQDYAIIDAGNNQTLMAIYTVPAGRTLLLHDAYCSLNKGGGAPSSLQVKLWVRDLANSYEKKIKWVIGLDEDATSAYERVWRPPLKITEKSDVFMTATTAGGAADISAGFDGELRTN